MSVFYKALWYKKKYIQHHAPNTTDPWTKEKAESIDPKESSNCSPVFPCEAMSDTQV